jgi:hypothetical protein
MKIEAVSTNAYVRVHVTSATGAGTVNYQVYGYSGTTASLGTTGGGGGGGITNVTASTPIASSGGTTPNISCSGCTVNNGVNTGTSAFTLDASAATTANAVKVPVQAGATATANGALAYDSTNNNLHTAQSGADAILPPVTITPTNNDCVKWIVSSGKVNLGDAGAVCGSGGGGGGGNAFTNYSGSQSLAAGSTIYLPIIGGAAGVSNANTLQIAVPATTFSNLNMNVSPVSPSNDTYTITFRKNGASTALTCTTPVGGGMCSDSTDSFTTASGDLLDMAYTATGTTTISAKLIVSAQYAVSGGGGGGGGTTNTQGTFATLPTCTTSLNTVYFFTDSFYDKATCLTGAATWTYFMNGRAVTPLPFTSFSTLSTTGTITTNATHGGVNLNFATSSNGRYESSYPATPFTRTAAMSCNLAENSTGGPVCGVYTRTSASGGTCYSLVYISNLNMQGYVPGFAIISHSGATCGTYITTNAQVNQSIPIGAQSLWMKITDDGTTTTFWYGVDGVNYNSIFSYPSFAGTAIGIWSGADGNYSGNTTFKTWNTCASASGFC